MIDKEERIAELEQEVRALKKIVEKQAAEIARLKELLQLKQLKESPSIFKPNRKTRQKRPGRKPSHKGVTRPLPDHIDEEIELKLGRCPDCGIELEETTEVRERYVEDIRPQRNYFVRKYKIHRSWCPKCKEIKSPRPIDVIPKCRFGLFLALFVCFQKFGIALPINKIQKELRIYFGLQVSQGEIAQMIERTALLFGPKFEELKSRIREAAANNVDETSWRTNGINKWVWTFVSKEIALFKIEKSRGHKVPLSVLGKSYDGIIGSDRYASYNKLEEKTRSAQQKCWAHIMKNAKELAKYHKEGKYIRRVLRRLYMKAKQFEKEDKESDIRGLIDEIDKLGQRKFESWNCYKFVQSVCVKHRDNLLRFVNNPDVDSTNNRAERSLRPLVRIRKISGCNRSRSGERATEILSSIIQTCQLQNKDFFEEGLNFLRSVPMAK